jgi:LemA protein
MTDALLPWLALLVVLGLWMLGAHNRITALRAAVLAAWAPVDQLLTQRGQAVAALLAAVAVPLAGESAALDAVAQAQVQVQAALEAVRRRPVAQDSVADLSKADAVLAAVLVRVLALVDQPTGLRAQPEVAQALAVLASVPAHLAFARQVYNQAGAGYNAATRQFPTRLLGSVLRFGDAGRL